MSAIKPLVAIVILTALAVPPAGADHATECRDEYVCASEGRALSVSGTLNVEDGTISVTAERHQGQRFSSEGHIETDAVSATLTLRPDGGEAVSCSPDPSTIIFSASEAADQIQVAASDESCSFDLQWTADGTPSPSVQRTTELVPGVPPAFYAAAALGVTVSRTAPVAGVALAREASGRGTVRDHLYAGHVTLSE